MSENTGNKPKNVFTNRNYRLVFFGALVSELGNVLYSFAVSFYILEITGRNAFLQGLYLAVCGAVLLLMTPLGGVIGDRYNKAKIMFLCDYLKGAGIVLATLVMLLYPDDRAHVAVLFVTGILGNAIGGIFSPAAGTLLPHIVEEDSLQQGNAYFSVKNALQSIFGVVLAGVLYAALSIYTLFFVVGVCYILSGVSEMFIRYRHTVPEGRLTARLVLADMKSGFLYLKTQKALMALMASMLFVNFFLVPVYSNFVPYFIKTDVAGAPSYLFDRLLTPELWSSAFEVAFGITSLISSVVLSTRRQQEKCGRKTAVLLCMIAGLMLALTGSYRLLVEQSASLNGFLLAFCLGMLIFGYLIPCINVPINTALMRMVDKDKLSKVISIVDMFSQGLIPFSTLLAGVLLQFAGSTALLAACSVGFTVTALLLLFNKQVKDI